MTRTHPWCWRARPEDAAADGGTAPSWAPSRGSGDTPGPVTGRATRCRYAFTRPRCISHEYEEST